MSVSMDEGIRRWTAKRKSALVVEIIQGKTTVAGHGSVGRPVSALCALSTLAGVEMLRAGSNGRFLEAA